MRTSKQLKREGLTGTDMRIREASPAGIVLHAQMKQGGSEGCFVFLESINVATSSALERTYAKEIR